MMNYMSTQRKAIDKFASLNRQAMPPLPEVAQKKKRVVTAKTTMSQPVVVIENVNCCNGDGHTEQAPTSSQDRLPADCMPTKAECDLWLWENLGNPDTLDQRREIYQYIINLERNDN